MHSEMSDLLQQGIAALKAGDKTTAHRLLDRAVRVNPRDEHAWLWLSGAVDSDEERLACLEKVLAINPHNEPAQRGMSALEQKRVNRSPRPASTLSPPSPVSSPAPVTLDHSPALDPASSEEQQALSGLAELVAHDLVKGKGRKAVIAQLIQRGFSEPAVEQLVADVAYQLNPVFIKKFKRRMVRGLLWTIAGIVVTVGTFIFAEQLGGMSLLCYGAILWGLVDFVAGLVGWLTYRV